MTERPAWALAFFVALPVGLPLAILTASLLLPGDPDDPNTKAFIIGLVALGPTLVLSGLLWGVLAWALPQTRRQLTRAIAPVLAQATSAWLIAISRPIANATPSPETPEDVAAARIDPHLWADGATRMVAVAVLLAAFGTAAIAWSARNARRAPTNGQ